MWWWVLPAVLALNAGAVWRTRRDVLLGEVLRTSHRWRLPLTATAHEDAVRRAHRRVWGDVLGSSLGALAGAAAALVAGDHTFWPVVLGLLVGGTLGSAATSFSRFPSPTTDRRVSHARDVVIGDLQPRWLTVLAWSSPVAAVVTVATASLVRADPWSAPGSGYAVAVSLAATLVALVGHAVVRHGALRAPRAARTDLELAWQDGFVSWSVVRTSLAVVVPAAAAATIAVVPAAVDSGIAFLPAVFLLVGLAASARPERTFRRRLWDDRVFELTPQDLAAGPAPA